MTRLPNARAKNLGKYYTPLSLAQPIAKWAIRDRRARFLDPSFGGCSFLIAASDRLRSFGNKWPGRCVYGVDVDEEARSYLLPLFQAGASPDNFLTTDFLRLKPRDIPGAPFDAICGNPPFVRHNMLSKQKVKDAVRALDNTGVTVPNWSSYWVYFLMHSLTFLKRSGRLGMVLPTSFLYTAYSEEVWSYLRKVFRSILVVALEGRVFDGAQETIVLLLAEEFGSPNDVTKTAIAPSISKLANIMEEHMIEFSSRFDRAGKEKPWSRCLVDEEASKIYDRLKSHSHISYLSDWADVKIGAVTGCNAFFTISESQRKNLGISSDFVKPVITRGKQLKGLKFSAKDYESIRDANKPCHLLAIESSARLTRPLAMYVRKGIRNHVSERLKCRIRDPWYSLVDLWKPDAFLNYMTSSFPHVTLNDTEAICTNSVHRVRFNDRVDEDVARCIALASTCSLTQLSVELVGRSYGGGVLKLEPSEARSMILCVPDSSNTISKAFGQIDRELRRGNRETAIAIADNLVLRRQLRLSARDASALRDSWRSLVALRFRRSVLSTSEVMGVDTKQEARHISTSQSRS